MRTQSITLRDVQDAQGHRLLTATSLADGSLRIHGLDAGNGVEEFFGPGNREYEWAWKVTPDGVSQLKSVLGVEADLFEAMKTRFSDERASDLFSFLNDHNIPFESWSRLGD